MTSIVDTAYRVLLKQCILLTVTISFCSVFMSVEQPFIYGMLLATAFPIFASAILAGMIFLVFRFSELYSEEFIVDAVRHQLEREIHKMMQSQDVRVTFLLRIILAFVALLCLIF
jgi:hypothetical protein